jgi:uncharacterized protein (TIGR01777 family)
MNKLVIAGGNGFLGGVLAEHFQKQFNDIVILTRHPQVSHQNIRYVVWDAKTLGDWKDELSHAEVLINLTGKNVNCRYTEKNKAEILNSRLDSTQVLGEAIRNAPEPPKLWLQTGSSTIYNHSYQTNDEDSNNIGDDFSMTVCKRWEQTFWEEFCPSTKKILMRVAIVLGNEGGAWPTLKRLTKLGLGGNQGHGDQMISWIQDNDYARVTEWLIHHGTTNGVYNVCSPAPIANKMFMKMLRKSLNMTVGLPTPEWMLRAGATFIGTETELVLKSRCVVPKNLLDQGFRFQYPDFEKALLILNR